MIMPLVSRAFEPGKAKQTIEAIENPEERDMAWAEYAQYTGDGETAVARAKRFLTHEDPMLCMSAHIVCFISGLATGDAAGARDVLLSLDSMEPFGAAAPVGGAYCASVIKIMLFLKEREYDVGNDIPERLPEGAKFFVCYFLALREYLAKKYENAVGMAKAALMMGATRYPIAGVYLHLISAASLARIRQQQEAQRHFLLAWELARPDGLLAPFGMKYVMLAGFNKKHIRPQNAEAYKAISRYADGFLPAWIDVHNGLVDWHENYGLTNIEHIAAMLFKSGLSVKEVSSYMGISVNTVKRHLAVVYQKTGVKKREELPDNVIR